MVAILFVVISNRKNVHRCSPVDVVVLFDACELRDYIKDRRLFGSLFSPSRSNLFDVYSRYFFSCFNRCTVDHRQTRCELRI